MDGFVEADKVFESLFNGQYVERFEWKNLNKQSSKYNVSFCCEKCQINAVHTFQVLIIGGTHYISNTAIKTFSKIHKIEVI